MSSLDPSRALTIESATEFAAWLRANGQRERDALLAIYKKGSGKQTVSFDALLEVALCHGWVDTQTKGIDERYAIRFRPRRPGSNWSERNRAIAQRLIAGGRMTEAGMAALAQDFDLPL